MSIEKSELKILIAQNLGADIEDRLESAKRSVHHLEGGAEALRQAAIAVPAGVIAKIDILFNEGNIKEGMTALEVYEKLKKYVSKCGDFLSHLSENEKSKINMQQGEVNGIQVAMRIVKDMYDKEIASVQAVKDHLDAIASGDEEAILRSSRGAARPSGVRPGPSTASVRKAQGGNGDANAAAIAAHGTLAERRAAAKAKKAEASKVKSLEDMTEEELSKLTDEEYERLMLE